MAAFRYIYFILYISCPIRIKGEINSSFVLFSQLHSNDYSSKLIETMTIFHAILSDTEKIKWKKKECGCLLLQQFLRLVRVLMRAIDDLKSGWIHPENMWYDVHRFDNNKNQQTLPNRMMYQSHILMITTITDERVIHFWNT